MAGKKSRPLVRTTHGPTFVRVETGSLFSPEEVGAEIRNMYPTEEGTLRSVWGPSPYSPNFGDGLPSFNGNLHGIGHFTLSSGKELLLIQWGDVIRVFRGWKAGGTAAGTPAGAPEDVWESLVGPAATSPQVENSFGADLRPRFPAQFERTPGGVVIIPRGSDSRPYYYDGTVVLPLGYDRAPSPPVGWGPETDVAGVAAATAAINSEGYHHDGACLHYDFAMCRVGTINTAGLTGSTVKVLGTLQRGHYQAAVQWIDRWGNLSPSSGRSNSIIFYEEKGFVDDVTAYDLTVESLLKQIAWCGIEPGPTGTIGRILLRSKDQLHAGTTALFEVPASSFYSSLAFSTIPDNATDLYPDNVPDSWLLLEGADVIPVKPFKLYKTAFGHGFAANYDDEPGLVRWTLAGRWGTFLRGDYLYPDPQGAEITGMHPVPGGLLIFTLGSTFLVEQKDVAGVGFKAKTVHASLGCAAPNSIKTLSTGETIWLSREGFCSYESAGGMTGGAVKIISQDIDRYVRDFNRGRLLQAVALVDPRTKTYRCWLAWRGSATNDMCWEFDGTGWRQRNELVNVNACCVTDDHRRYQLVAGQATDSASTTSKGVWILDHQNFAWTPLTRDAVIETAWLRVARSKTRGSPMEVFFWLRETESGTLSIEVHRDWRIKANPETFTVQLHPTDDVPPFWGTTTWGATDANGDAVLWPRRRPYWIRGSIFVPSAEVFKLRIVHTGDLEFVGMTFDEVMRGDPIRVPK